MNPQGYWYVNCHSCGQGRLFAEVRDDTGELILQCEECSRAWNHPNDVSKSERAFLAIEIPTHFADGNDMERAGWSEYHFHEAST